jgi:proline dehydrogenase
MSVTNTISSSVNNLFRGTILGATSNRAVSAVVNRYGMRFGAARFVAGETFDEAIPILRSLNDEGLSTNTTILGEGVNDREQAASVVRQYREVLDRIASERLDTNVALKLTSLGLTIDEQLAFENVQEIVRHAASHGNFIRIDMEDSPWVDATLRIYRRLRESGNDNVGTVLQSYLYRTRQDFRELLDLEPNLRLVKGAYLEPAAIAYQKKRDVDTNYLRLAKRMLSYGGYTAIATHDERIIEYVIAYTVLNEIPAERFEFQMLYGISRQLQLDLVAEGYKVRVATPFGPEWYHYLMRRLAERPANLLFIGRNLLRG